MLNFNGGKDLSIDTLIRVIGTMDLKYARVKKLGAKFALTIYVHVAEIASLNDAFSECFNWKQVQ